MSESTINYERWQRYRPAVAELMWQLSILSGILYTAQCFRDRFEAGSSEGIKPYDILSLIAH